MTINLCHEIIINTFFKHTKVYAISCIQLHKFGDKYVSMKPALLYIP